MMKTLAFHKQIDSSLSLENVTSLAPHCSHKLAIGLSRLAFREAAV